MNEAIERLETALEQWHAAQDRQDSHIPVLNAVAAAVRMEAPVLVPVLIPEDALTGEDLQQMQEGGTVHIDHEIRMQIQHLQGEDGKHYIPLFTGEAEVSKGAATSTVSQSLAVMLECALQEEGCSGIVLNPWDKSATLNIDVLQKIREAAAPSRDEQELRQVLMNCLQGLARGERDLLQELVCPEAVIFGDGAPEKALTVSELCDAVDAVKAEAEEEIPCGISLLDMTGGTAAARVALQLQGVSYTALVSLLKTQAGWRVASALCHDHSTDSRSED